MIIVTLNLHTYNYKINNNISLEICDSYLQNWMKYEELARNAVAVEFNIKENVAWKNIKKDGRKMWSVIDWKGKPEVKNEKPIHESQIQKYFRNIFQSKKTKNHPTVANIMNDLHNYFVYIPMLDDLPDKEEIKSAINFIHRGIGIDGCIEGNTEYHIGLFTRTRTKSIMSSYPEDWNKQILHAITYHNPDLRGIAVALLLSRVYDNIIERRFNSWYTPNYHQAGFRKGQGCLLQIFLLTLLIKFSKSNNKDLFVAFMDYEKAFDYANRMNIICDLISKGCGCQMTKAIANIYIYLD